MHCPGAREAVCVVVLVAINGNLPATAVLVVIEILGFKPGTGSKQSRLLLLSRTKCVETPGILPRIDEAHLCTLGSRGKDVVASGFVHPAVAFMRRARGVGSIYSVLSGRVL